MDGYGGTIVRAVLLIGDVYFRPIRETPIRPISGVTIGKEWHYIEDLSKHNLLISPTGG